MKVCETYCQQLTVRNTGTLTRRIKFISEPNSDITFKIIGNTELISGASVAVNIYVEPTKKNSINRERFFYAMAEHPDIVWEIPIIVIGKCPEVFVPQLICLYKVPVDTNSYYQFVMYNPLETEITFSISSKYEGLTVMPLTSTIAKDDYCKILISGKMPTQIMTSSLNVSVKNGKCFIVKVYMEPSEQAIHLSTSVLNFEDTYMGSKVQKHFHICNKTMKNVGYRWQCNESADVEQKANEKADEELQISEFLKIQNKSGCIPPMNSALSIVTFHPPIKFDYNEEEEPPFKVNVTIYLRCPIIESQTYQFQINASILGPDIEITTKDIDMGNIFMGQMQCLKLDVFNKGPIDGKISYKDHTDQNEIRCQITPPSMNLKVNSRKSFHLKFYRRDVGKFLTKFSFKIQSGNIVPMLLRGTCLPAKVKIWPESFEYGTIPICIPQKRFAMIGNPLPVPIVVEPVVIDDGAEDPLTLCVDNSNLPLNARPKTFYNSSRKSDFLINAIEENVNPDYSNFQLEPKSSTTTQPSRTASVNFQNKVIENITGIAEQLLQNVKNEDPQLHLDPEIKIIDTALDCILEKTDYFDDLKYKQNYLNMDWQALPSDAKEIGIEVERFHLQPNESKSFPVVLVPNSAGPGIKTIDFKACPLGAEHADLKAAVRSKYMVNSLRIQYTCTVPALEYNEYIKFHAPIYVDMVHNFHMEFKNIDTVPGFVYYKVIPQSSFGKMMVEESSQKFFLASDQKIRTDCSVIFYTVGTVTLCGMVRIIGKLLQHHFTIEADVIPPKIRITPEKATNNQQVLEFTRTRIFIENICPTVATFCLCLKNEKYQFLEPWGGRLGPGQKILISVFSKFYDPGMFKNSICVNLKHAEKMIIPLTFIVEGTPILFEPNIKSGLDCGNLYRNKGFKDNFVTITNYGERTYRLLFQRKQKNKASTMAPVTVFELQPSGITIGPKSVLVMNIKLNTSREISAEEEFSVDGMGEDNTRFKFFTFLAKCVIIKANVTWSVHEICLEIGNADKEKDNLQEIVCLTNTTGLTLNVSLNLFGNFILRNDETGLTEKTLDLCLMGKQSKQFTVYLNEDEINPIEACLCYNGYIQVKANNKPQKSLLLHAKIVNPHLVISTPEVTFFAHNAESYAHICLENCGPLKALFTWKQESFSLTKTKYPKSSNDLYSKTISEIILNLPDQLVMKIPEVIKDVMPDDLILMDQCEMLEEDEEEEEEGVVPATSENISAKTSISSNNNRFSSTKPSASVRSSVIKTTSIEEALKSEATISKPLPALFESLPQVEVTRVLDYFAFGRPVCAVDTEKSSKGNEIDIGDTICEDKIEEIKPEEGPKSIRFQVQKGEVSAKSTAKAFLFLPAIKEGDTIISKYSLNVAGGSTETLNITITSLKGSLNFSTTEIDLGKQVWHKILSDKLQVTNHTPYAVKVTLIDRNDPNNEEYYTIDGHVSVGSPKMFIMMPGSNTSIKWKAIMGLRYNFFEDIGVEINNNTTAIPIHFHGSGFMPVIIPTNIHKMAEKSLETVASYLSMRKIFESIEAKKKPSVVNTKYLRSLSSVMADEQKSCAQTSATVSINKNKSKPQVEDSFIALNYSDDKGPQALEIERLIETWKFITELNKSNELRTKFHKFYCDCVCQKAMQFDPVINLNNTVCRPVPWELPVYVMNMGLIEINETKNFHLVLTFFGPGKVFLSARTPTAIPGLFAWFEDLRNIESPNSFVYYIHTPEEDMPKKYKNMHERGPMDVPPSEEPPKLPHAHSYDMTTAGTHERLPPQNVQKIKERYSKMDQPFKKQKNPLILAEICQSTEDDWDNSTFKLMFMFTCIKDPYENSQIIEDYLYIDIHLGPTLPILLKGEILN